LLNTDFASKEPDPDDGARPRALTELAHLMVPSLADICIIDVFEQPAEARRLEVAKILDIPGLAVEPTCVRVPVLVGHGVATTLYFDRPVSGDEAMSILSSAPGVEVWKDRTPTPLDSAGIDEVLVGRVRETVSTPGGINLWVVGDNLRKGAALNAVQIAELLV
jgi:aspartate-semialdehyde dehydrogenase